MSKKKNEKNAVVVATEALPEANLGSAALAQLADYDLKQFEGVELDVTENTDLFANDFLIPKIWLMQEMSDLAKDKSRKDIESGDFVDSQSEDILLKVDAEAGFIPIIVLKTFKRWQTFKIIETKNDVKKEFVSSEIMVLGKNENYAYEFTEEGVKHVRRQVISAYVLLGNDAQKGIAKPYIIDFASTSKLAGRNLVSDIATLNKRKVPSYVGWFKLSSGEATFNDHDVFVKQIKFGGFLPQEMFPFLKEAYDDVNAMIKANTIEIDDRDLHESAKAASSSADNGNVVDQVTENASI